MLVCLSRKSCKKLNHANLFLLLSAILPTPSPVYVAISPSLVMITPLPTACSTPVPLGVPTKVSISGTSVPVKLPLTDADVSIVWARLHPTLFDLSSFHLILQFVHLTCFVIVPRSRSRCHPHIV